MLLSAPSLPQLNQYSRKQMGKEDVIKRKNTNRQVKSKKKGEHMKKHKSIALVAIGCSTADSELLFQGPSSVIGRQSCRPEAKSEPAVVCSVSASNRFFNGFNIKTRLTHSTIYNAWYIKIYSCLIAICCVTKPSSITFNNLRVAMVTLRKNNKMYQKKKCLLRISRHGWLENPNLVWQFSQLQSSI